MVLERGRDPDPADVHWGRLVKTQPSVRPLKTCTVDGGLEGVRLKTGRPIEEGLSRGSQDPVPWIPSQPQPLDQLSGAARVGPLPCPGTLGDAATWIL